MRLSRGCHVPGGRTRPSGRAVLLLVGSVVLMVAAELMAALAADVILIGAGISSLTSAHILKKLGVKVRVVEAADRIGGRILPENVGGHWGVIQLGAEGVHGNTTLLTEYLDVLGWERVDNFVTSQGDGGPSDEAVNGAIGLYFWKSKGQPSRLLRYDTRDAEFRRTNALLQDIGSTPFTEENCKTTVGDYLRRNNVPHEMLLMADASSQNAKFRAPHPFSYANTLCTSLDKLSLGEMAVMERQWENEGAPDSHIEGGFGALIEHFASGLSIDLGRRVVKVDSSSSPGMVTVTAKLSNGATETLRARAAIVAVPLSILQDGDIAFEPPLPAATVDAFKTIGWQRDGVKILMLFREKLWAGAAPDGIICSGDECPVPELMLSHSEGGGCTVAGFAMGEYARGILAGGKESALEAMLTQLELIFGSAARRHYVRGYVQDWGADPLIRGAYSSPMYPGAHAGRIAVCSPQAAGAGPGAPAVAFAGEHACREHQMTVHAAMESGERAAAQVLAVLGKPQALGRTGDLLLKVARMDPRRATAKKEGGVAVVAAAAAGDGGPSEIPSQTKLSSKL